MAAAQDQTVKIQFEVENLLPQNAKTLQTQLKVVAGVNDCAVAGIRVTISVKPESTLKFSDIKGVVADLKPVKDEKIAIKYDSIKLEGKVTLSFNVTKNQDKIQQAVLSVANVERAEQKGDEYLCTIKSPGGAKLMDIVAAVAKKTESADNTALASAALIKDVVWTGGPKPTVKDKPSTSNPDPNAKPAPKPGSCKAGGCKPGS